MMLILILLIIIIVICLILIFGITAYNKFQENIIRINEAEANIDSVLRKRFDLLNKSVEIINKELNNNKNDDEKVEVMHTIVQLRSKKLSNFELDSQLYTAIDEFQKYYEDYDNLEKNKEFMKIEINLVESESEIVALRKYYNDITKDYNKLVSSFPSNIIALIKKYKKKDYFEEKEKEKDLLLDLKS